MKKIITILGICLGLYIQLMADQLLYVYDVEKNRCDKIEAYKGIISQYDLDNPKFLGRFSEKGKEIIFVTVDDRMFVFVETLENCFDYQKRFQEDISKEDVLNYNLLGEE